MLKNLLIFTAIFLPALALADVEPAVRNSELYGMLTLIPPVAAIVLAFITKDVILSLFLGVLSGTFLVGMVDHGSSLWLPKAAVRRRLRSGLASTQTLPFWVKFTPG